MSSSLTSVGSVGASVVAGQGPAAVGKGAPKTLMDVFAALLGNVGGEAGAEITQSSTATINDIELKGVAREIIASLLQGKDGPANPDAPVADTPGAATPAVEADGSELSGLADLLARIEASLEAGQTADPALLEKLDVSIDALAVAIGGSVEFDTAVAVGSEVDPLGEIEAAATAKASVPGETAETDPAEPIHPMLKGLADKLKELGEKLASADGELAQKLTALAERLGRVRTTIAELLERVPELKTTIGELMQLKVEAKASTQVTPPALAAPELRLPQNASLSAKKTDDGSAAAPATTPDDAPAEGQVAEAPKLQVKAEVKADAKVEVKVEAKADQPTIATGPDKREALAPAAPAPAATAPADATVASAATTTIGTQAAMHGEVRAVHSAYQAPSPINLPRMAFEIVRQVQQGVSKFQIRLDPPELGRVDVKLDMDQSGQVNAKLLVERSETLDLLQRDQRALERALAQAGLDTSKTNLEFSLRQNPFAGQDGKGQGQPGASPFASDVRAPVVAEAEAQAAVTLYRGSASPGGVNIFV